AGPRSRASSGAAPRWQHGPACSLAHLGAHAKRPRLLRELGACLPVGDPVGQFAAVTVRAAVTCWPEVTATASGGAGVVVTLVVPCGGLSESEELPGVRKVKSAVRT